MYNIPKFLAEGAYGCVHKPSLHCNKDVKIENYNKKVSKILSKKHAKKELDEYVMINNADKTAKYYLGQPETCTVEDDIINRAAIADCKMREQILNNMEDYNLIIMKDGGLNLFQFAEKMEKESVTKENIKEIELFWIEAHRLIMGLKLFLQKNISHHDLKPQNIVYDEKNRRSNFIDFGLMEYIPKSIAACKENTYTKGRNHWSYPFETFLVNKINFEQHKQLSVEEREHAFKEYINKAIEEQWMNIFFKYAVITSKIDRAEYLDSFAKFFITDIDAINYKDFLQKHFASVDIYGLGIAFSFVLHKTKKFVNDTFFNNMKDLIGKMFAANLIERIEIEDLIVNYENILRICDFTTKYNIHFDQNKIKPIPNIIEKVEDNIFKSVKKIAKVENTMTDKDFAEIADKDPVIKKCQKGKVINPPTGRCIKKKTIKKCPKGKIINSKTGRCVISTKNRKSCNVIDNVAKYFAE